MKTLRKLYGLALLGAMMVAIGCKKKETTSLDPTPFQETAEDQARSESEQNFINDVIDNQGETSVSRRVAGVDSTYLPPCATVTYDSTLRRLTIDFGRTNCLCRDGVYRRGKILVTFSGAWWPQPGARALITTDSFFVNDNQHIVEKVLFHQGLNQAGERIIQDTVRTHQVLTPNGTTQWSAVRTFRQTQGQTTWQRWDDVWFIGGSAQGTSRRGNPFTSQILDSLKIKGSCYFRVPVKGIVQTSTQSHTVRVNYDPYGNEVCDRVASVQVDNGNPVNVTIR